MTDLKKEFLTAVAENKSLPELIEMVEDKIEAIDAALILREFKQGKQEVQRNLLSKSKFKDFIDKVIKNIYNSL